MATSTTPTPLELCVLIAIRDGRNPFTEVRRALSAVEGALARCRKKGFVMRGPMPMGAWSLTDAGRAVAGEKTVQSILLTGTKT